MTNTVITGKIDCFILETDRETRFEARSHEEVREFVEKNMQARKGVIYFTRFLTDAGTKEEQLGYDPNAYIGQRVWKYTCKCGDTEWRTAELSKERAEHFMCSECDND